MLYFGDEGFGWINSEGEQSSALPQCCSKPVVDVATGGKSLYAVTNEGVAIYSTRLCQIGVVDFHEATCITRTVGKLVIGGRQGLSVHDISDALHPKCAQALDGIDVRKVARPLGSEAGTVLASLYDQSALLLNIAGSAIEETAAFPQAPWFASCLRFGDLLVRFGSNGRSLDVSRFAASSVV